MFLNYVLGERPICMDTGIRYALMLGLSALPADVVAASRGARSFLCEFLFSASPAESGVAGAFSLVRV